MRDQNKKQKPHVHVDGEYRCKKKKRLYSRKKSKNVNKYRVKNILFIEDFSFFLSFSQFFVLIVAVRT